MYALLFFAAQTSAAAPPPPPLPPAQPKCDTPAHAQFDFWVGEWDVYPNLKDPAKAPLVARSRIERLYAGCAVRENWMPLKGPSGGSLNNLDPITGRWHQVWIGSQPGRVLFEGGRSGASMILTGWWQGVNGPGKDGLIRMTYTPLDATSVRQHGELSTDHGVTWSDSFDFIYRKRAPKG